MKVELDGTWNCSSISFSFPRFEEVELYNAHSGLEQHQMSPARLWAYGTQILTDYIWNYKWASVFHFQSCQDSRYPYSETYLELALLQNGNDCHCQLSASTREAENIVVHGSSSSLSTSSKPTEKTLSRAFTFLKMGAFRAMEVTWDLWNVGKIPWLPWTLRYPIPI